MPQPGNELKSFAPAKEKEHYDSGKMRQAPRELHRTENEERNGEEDSEHERIEPCRETQDEDKAEERFNRAGGEGEEVVCVPLETEELHEIPIVLVEEVDPKLRMEDLLRKPQNEKRRAGADAKDRERVAMEVPREMRERPKRH